MFKVLSTYIFEKIYIKCSIWMVAERGRPIIGRTVPKG
jgi:hypothetical protein